MDKKCLERLKKIHRILNNVGDKVMTITTGNVAHNAVIHRSTLENTKKYLIFYVRAYSDDKGLRELMDDIYHRLDHIIGTLRNMSPNNFNEGTNKYLGGRLKHYAKLIEEYIE